MVTAVASNVIALFPDRIDFTPDLDAELISDVLLLMEAALIADIAVRACVGIDRVRRVHLAIGAAPHRRLATLTPAQARLTAHHLFHEQAFAGCGEVAARLIEASVEIDHLPASHVPAAQPATHGFTGLASSLGVLFLTVGAFILGRAFA